MRCVVTRQVSNPRLRSVVDRAPQPPEKGEQAQPSAKDELAMAQLEDMFLKLDHLQSTISKVAIDIVQLREHQSSQKENNQKFWAQDWPIIIKGQNSLQEKCNAIEKELSELKPLLKTIVDHEQRLRDVERSVIKMGVTATFVGALFGTLVTWVLKFVKIGS